MVPLYNHAAYIAEAMASVLSQGPVLREAIVIDDGSTDNSAEVMQGIAARDPRIRFRSRPNRGAHATLNEAIAEAQGDYVAILNSDDIYGAGRLAALAALLDGDPGAGIAASGIGFIDGAGGKIANAWYEEAHAFHRGGAAMGTALVNANFLMTTSNFMFRRGLTEAIGGFAGLRYVHDLDFALRALAFGHGIRLAEAPLLRYRLHASNTIKEDHGGVRAEWAMAAAAYLHALWDRPDAPAPDWAEAAALGRVLRRHELDVAVPLCMAYLRRHGGGTLATSPLAGDAPFRAQIASWV